MPEELRWVFSIASVVIVVCVTGATLIYDHRRARLTFLSPALLLGGVWILAYGARPLYLLSRGVIDSPFFTVELSSTGLSQLVETQVIASVGIVTFGVGYWLPGRIALPSIPRLIVPPRVRFGLVWGFSFTSAIVIVATVNSLLSSTGYSVIGYLEHLSARTQFLQGRHYLLIGLYIGKGLGLAFLAVGEWREWWSNGYRIVILVTFGAVVLLIDSLTGSRSTLLMSLLALMAIATFRSRFSLTRTQLLATALVALTIVYGYWYATRGMFNRSLSLPTNAVDAVVNSGSFNSVDALYHIRVSYPDEGQYEFGSTYVSLVTHGIPRGWIGEKPKTGQQVYTERIFPKVAEAGSERSVSYMGELYMNFGIFGVLIGMLTLGFLAKEAYRSFLERLSPVSLVVFPMLAWNLIALQRSALTSVVYQFFYSAIPFVVCAVVIWSKREVRNRRDYVGVGRYG